MRDLPRTVEPRKPEHGAGRTSFVRMQLAASLDVGTSLASINAAVRLAASAAHAPSRLAQEHGTERMTDLLDLARERSGESYTAHDIEVLEGLEPVRRRPGMYVGGTDERALHHLVAEVLDNAMDEAVAGHATRIELELSAPNRVTVRDNGRGIPIDPHPKFPGRARSRSS